MKKIKFKKRNSYNRESIVCLVIAGLMTFACLFPIWIAFCASISQERDLVMNGYPIWIPENYTFGAYQYLYYAQGSFILRSLRITLLSVLIGTVMSLAVSICYGYALAQKKAEFELQRVFSFLLWFASMFSGGILPWYILCTRYYGLSNNIWALTIPSLMTTFHVYLLRNNFKGVPAELYESAKLDGASHFQCMIHIAIPLAKVGIVTVAMFTALRYWNDFHLSLYLGTKRDYYSLQKLLYEMLSNLQQMFQTTDVPMAEQVALAPNTARMAFTLLTILPVLFIYPFAQKYLVQGVTTGAVKG